jgi:hypothetical protein
VTAGVATVRRAVPGDEPVLRALRLEALGEAPEAFSSSYEHELARTQEDWRRWLSSGVTLLLEDAGLARGLVAGHLDWARGVGARLVRLDVMATNLRARRLYQRLGVHPTGRAAVREADGRVELRMERSVGSAT